MTSKVVLLKHATTPINWKKKKILFLVFVFQIKETRASMKKKYYLLVGLIRNKEWFWGLDQSTVFDDDVMSWMVVNICRLVFDYMDKILTFDDLEKQRLFI